MNCIIATSTSSLFQMKRNGGISHTSGASVASPPLKTEHTQMGEGEKEEGSHLEGMKARLLTYPQAWGVKHNFLSSEVCQRHSAL